MNIQLFARICIVFTVVFLSGLCGVGCGQKGDLFLPDEAATSVSR